jgi:hypothetical protein
MLQNGAGASNPLSQSELAAMANLVTVKETSYLVSGGALGLKMVC